MFNDQKGSYISLLEKCGYTTLLISLHTIRTEVFKSLNNLNPTFMNQMFEAKIISYELRNSTVLFYPKWQKVTYGKYTFKNHGSHIWNLLSNEIKTISYELRNFNVLFQPKWQKVTYGKHTFKNYGSHIWNLLPNQIKS